MKSFIIAASMLMLLMAASALALENASINATATNETQNVTAGNETIGNGTLENASIIINGTQNATADQNASNPFAVTKNVKPSRH